MECKYATNCEIAKDKKRGNFVIDTQMMTNVLCSILLNSHHEEIYCMHRTVMNENTAGIHQNFHSNGDV